MITTELPAAFQYMEWIRNMNSSLGHAIFLKKTKQNQAAFN